MIKLSFVHDLLTTISTQDTCFKKHLLNIFRKILKNMSWLLLHAWYLIFCIHIFRCFAALGDVSKSRYLHETNKIAMEAAKVTVSI